MAKKPNTKPNANQNPAAAPVLGPGIQLPPGITLQHPLPPLPPDIEGALADGRRSGRYFVVVATAEQNGDLRVTAHRSGEFSPDWLLRAWQLALNDIVVGNLNPVPAIRLPGDTGADEPEGNA